MANVNHADITDAAKVHEPKGIPTATAGTVYVADGSGSGNFRTLSSYLGAYLSFDLTGTGNQHTVTTSDTILHNDFTTGEASGFTVDRSAGNYTRFKYTGTPDIEAFISFTVFAKQASGSSRDVQFALFKDATELAGSRGIRTQTTASWGSITVNGFTSMSTNDYIDIRVKADDDCTIQMGSAFMSLKGVPTA